MPLFKGQFRQMPAETIATIYSLVDQGVAYSEIARQIGCHRQAVYYRVKKRREDKSVSLTIRLRRRVEQLRRKGLSYEKIAIELDCSSGTVFRCAKRWGIKKSKLGCKGSASTHGRVTPELERKIIALVEKGHSYRSIAKHVGSCSKTVSRVAKEHGAEQRRSCRHGLTCSETDSLKQLLAGNCTYSEIAKQLRLAETTIARHAKQLGHRRRRGPLTTDELDRIDQLTAEGRTFREISSLLGLSKSAVSSNARRRAIERGEAPRVRHLNKVERAELLALYVSGETPKAIARKLRVAGRTVHQHIRNWKDRVEKHGGVGSCPRCNTICQLPCATCAAWVEKKRCRHG